MLIADSLRLAGNSLRHWARHMWRRKFLLIALNLLWVTLSVPGLLLTMYGAVMRWLPLLVGGMILLLPSSLATFGLSAAAFEIGSHREVGIRRFFKLSLANWRKAVQWGALNFLVLGLLLANFRFYGSSKSALVGTRLGMTLSSLFLTLAASWLVWQTFALAGIVRMRNPSLRQAYRQSASLMLTRPLLVFVVAVLVISLVAAGILVPPLGLLFTFSAGALLVDQATAVAFGESSEGS